MTVAAPVTGSERAWILFYCGLLVLLVEFGAPYNGLIDVPVVFFLKNKLHLSANGIATFRLFAAMPSYLALGFGLVRDRFNPLGMGDRGFIALFGGLTAAAYGLMAFIPVSLLTLLLGVLAINCAFLMAATAMRGLLSMVANQHVMSGRVSSVWNIVLAVPLVTTYLAGGYLSELLEGQSAQAAARILFLAGSAIMALVAIFGLWRPRFLFDRLIAERSHRAPLISDLRRLSKHWPIYPALLIWFLWQFSPGTQTVLQVYLSDTLHASDAVFGDFNAIYYAAFVPTYLLFGFLCQRVALRRLLWLGTIFAVPQMMPLIFIHSAAGALIVAAPIGLMGGMATAAYTDLIIRSCPVALQGAMLGLATAAFWIAVRFGDLWGTDLYDHHGGFVVCALVTTAVYALILPVLLLIPRALIATRDGQAGLETTV